MSYQAFLSYSHSDLAFAEGLQRSLEGLGGFPIGKRSMRVFRDDTNLDAHPDLWGKIATALHESSHLILMASPDSAKSKWVHQEITRTS